MHRCIVLAYRPNIDHHIPSHLGEMTLPFVRSFWRGTLHIITYVPQRVRRLVIACPVLGVSYDLEGVCAQHGFLEGVCVQHGYLGFL